MRNLLFGWMLIAAFAASGCDPAALSATLQVRSAPPPPVFEFRDEPRFHYLSDYRVSVIADDGFGYDMFGCDGYYYLYSGSYWYRAPSAQGPFVAIDVRRVPRRVFDVDDEQYRWRNHPQDWRASNRHGRGHAYGHDRDDDHGDERDHN